MQPEASSVDTHAQIKSNRSLSEVPDGLCCAIADMWGGGRWLSHCFSLTCALRTRLDLLRTVVVEQLILKWPSADTVSRMAPRFPSK